MLNEKYVKRMEGCVMDGIFQLGEAVVDPNKSVVRR